VARKFLLIPISFRFENLFGNSVKEEKSGWGICNGEMLGIGSYP
jgi:hypothetical protein